MNAGCEGFVVWFSRIAICPVLRQPNAATARSVLPSPLKSAASTSATRGQPSSQKAPNLPAAEPAHPDHAPLCGRPERTARDRRRAGPACRPRRRRSAPRAPDAGCSAIVESALSGSCRLTDEHEPLPHVRAERPRAVCRRRVSTRLTFDTAGVLGMSGIVKECRLNRTGDSLGSGHVSGAGRRSGAWLVKNGRTCAMSGGSCTVRLTTAGGPIGGRRFSRMNIIRTNSSRHAFRGRMSGGGNGGTCRKQPSPAAHRRH